MEKPRGRKLRGVIQIPFLPFAPLTAVFPNAIYFREYPYSSGTVNILAEGGNTVLPFKYFPLPPSLTALSFLPHILVFLPVRTRRKAWKRGFQRRRRDFDGLFLFYA